MADGFYTNDDDIGCFGGYGSDGNWAYGEDGGNGFETRPSGALDERGAFGVSIERPQKRFPLIRRAGGSGDYGRAV